jgi:hypothetical protein
MNHTKKFGSTHLLTHFLTFRVFPQARNVAKMSIQVIFQQAEIPTDEAQLVSTDLHQKADKHLYIH